MAAIWRNSGGGNNNSGERWRRQAVVLALVHCFWHHKSPIFSIFSIYRKDGGKLKLVEVGAEQLYRHLHLYRKEGPNSCNTHAERE